MPEIKSKNVDAKKVFYTSDQKDALRKVNESAYSRKIPISESTGAMILDALGEQQNTLQNIESILQRIENAILPDEQSQ